MTQTIKKWIPYLVFLVIYIFTSLIGTILLVFGPDMYWKLTYAFTGQTIPQLYVTDVVVIMELIIGSLISITLGYLISTIIAGKINKSSKRELFALPQKNCTSVLATIVFTVLAIYGFVRIFSIIDLSSITGWLYYDSFINIRKDLMGNLSFLDFVIIYSLVPLFLAISIPSDLKNKRYILLFIKLAVLVVMNIYIFQKRPLVNGLLIISFLLFVYFYIGHRPRLKLVKKFIPVVLSACLIVYLLYAVGIYVNTIGEYDQVSIVATEKVDLTTVGEKQKKPNPQNDEKIKKDIFKSFLLETQTIDVPKFVYTNTMAFVGLINRTAFSAICYPVVFPEYVNYYQIDVGQDIIGFGTMPDDANLVWDILNPKAKGSGAMAAPFFIVLYSQGGIVIAVFGSLIVGFLLGFSWNLILSNKKNNENSSAFGALILLLSVLLAMASGRDSLLSSYGLLYPLLSLLFFYTINYILTHRRRNKINKIPQIVMLVTSGVVNDSRVLREARIAAENGFKVTVIGRKIPALGEIDTSLPFDTKLIPISRSENYGIFGKVVERIRIGLTFTAITVKYKPDIIHANDFDTLPFGFFAALFCGSELVYDSHELWSENDIVARSKWSKIIVKMLERFLAHQCDRVISVSNACAAWLKESYILDNITVVTNCPYAYVGDTLPKNTGFEILCHGTFAADRGYEELIDSARIVEKEGINIAIRGFGEKSEYYRELALSTGQKNITFLPKVPPFEVVKSASTSHVGVILTRPISISYELTVSNKLFECINAGLPVILSDVPEHRYLNEKYKFGIILEEITSECLAKAAIELKNDTNLYENLKQNAINAAKELRWENEGMKLISAYKNILINEGKENETDTVKKRDYINV